MKNRQLMEEELHHKIDEIYYAAGKIFIDTMNGDITAEKAKELSKELNKLSKATSLDLKSLRRVVKNAKQLTPKPPETP